MGASGRGKSTFAARLSAKTGIPHCSTDDFYWKVKFTERNDKPKSIEDIRKVYEKEEWIVDGSSRFPSIIFSLPASWDGDMKDWSICGIF